MSTHRVQLSPEAEALAHEAARAYLAWRQGRSVETARVFVAAMRRFENDENETGPNRPRGGMVEQEYMRAFRLLFREESTRPRPVRPPENVLDRAQGRHAGRNGTAPSRMVEPNDSPAVSPVASDNANPHG